MPDVDDRGAGDVEHQPQLAGADRERRVADRRIFGDAAVELRVGHGRLLDLSHQVEVGRRLVVAGGLDRYLGDDADEQGLAGANSQELADRATRRVAFLHWRGQEADLRLRSADGNDVTDRPTGVRFLLMTQRVGVRHRALELGQTVGPIKTVYPEGVSGG